MFVITLCSLLILVIFFRFLCLKVMAESSTEKGYSKQSLRDAVQGILNGRLTVETASDQFKIPKRTLQQNVKYDFFIYIS